MQSFLSPDISCAPVYAWVWNDCCSHDVIDKQLSEMQRLGIRAFYIIPEPKEFRPHNMPTNLTPDYLTPAYLDMYAYAVEKGKELGMYCWIYDEGGWPSGGACGKVLRDHPEYARQVLAVREHSFSADNMYKKTVPDTLAAFLNNGEMIEEGYRFAEDTVVSEYSIRMQNNGGADYPDLLNKSSAEYFIGITHEKYASALGDMLGGSVTAVFTDEPKAPIGAFNKELAEQYEKTFGESILPHLPLLAGRTAITDENIHVLYRWYDLCSRMFCENYLIPCKKWSNSHGMFFTGHMDVDHAPLGCVRGGGNYHLMRALRCLDIPGVDVIWHQLYPENKTSVRNDMNACNGFFPRYASSAAVQNGTDFAMTETFGVFGPGLTYEMMRYSLGYQAVRGINIFNLMTISLGRQGVFLAQELPSFTEAQIYYRDLALFNKYLERLSYVSSLGERVCETALYYPIHDFWGRMNAESAAQKFDELGRALEDIPVDFDIVDDDVIRAADGTEDGILHIGKALYHHIIIPENAYLPPETAEILDRFVRSGGKISYNATDAVPIVETERAGLRAMHRRMENGEIFCLFRENGETGEYTIHLPMSSGYRLYPEDGTVRRFTAANGIMHLSLAIGETAVLLLTEENLCAEEEIVFGYRYMIPDKFRFHRALELTCTEKGFESIEHSYQAESLSLGDWAILTGSAYSGSGVYETAFTLPEELVGKAGELDLGDVRYTAYVLLNNRSLGTVLMPPYRFRIPAGILSEENTLKVIVTNTPANWYTHTDYFDKWEILQLSPYFEGEMKYAENSVCGGLYGPVMLSLDN